MTRSNPLPYAIIGLGIGWLALSRSSPLNAEHLGSSKFTKRLARDQEDARHWLADTAHLVRDRLGDAAEAVRHGAEDIGHQASDAYHDIRDRALGETQELRREAENAARRGSYQARDMYEEGRERLAAGWEHGRDRANDAYEEARDRAENAYKRARKEGASTYDQVRDRVQSNLDYGRERVSELSQAAIDELNYLRKKAAPATDGFWTMVDEHPLAVGIMGVALGAALGASLPGTASEHRVVGSLGDKLSEAGHEFAREAGRKGRAVGDEVRRQRARAGV